MGKYMRKAKTTREVAVMDLSLGVRTRAKTLALQQHSSAYLQLRSRCLQKPPFHSSQTKKPQTHLSKPSRKLPIHSASPQHQLKTEDNVSHEQKDSEKNANLDIVQDSFGENFLEFEGRERGTRESTPCSLIRDPEIIRTPGSTTRTTSASENNRRLQNSLCRHIPTSVEMDEFFAGAEEEHQKQFIKKYNFDPVKDKPLPGRFDWERVDP